MKNKKTLLFIIAIVVIIGLIIGINIYQSSKEPEVIKIGAILPLTGSAATLGDFKRGGMMIALKEINEAGGIKGKRVEIIFEDSKNDAKTGVAIMKKFVETQKIPVIVSAMSGVSLNLTPIANKSHILLFANAGHPALSKSGVYVFRNFPSTEIETKPMATFIAQKKFKNLSILVINDDFGQSVRENLKNYLKGTDVKIVVEELLDKDGKDFKSLLTKVMAMKSDVVYLGGYGTAIGITAKQLRELGFKGHLLGNYGLLFPDVLAIAKEALEGAIVTSPDFDPESPEPAVKKFVSEYMKEFGKKPNMDAAMEYNTIKLIAEAIKQGGYSPDGMRKALLQIKNYKSIMGEIEVLPTRDIKIPIVLKTIKDGKIVDVKIQ